MNTTNSNPTADGKMTDHTQTERMSSETRDENHTHFNADNNNRDNAISATDFGPYSLRRRE